MPKCKIVKKLSIAIAITIVIFIDLILLSNYKKIKENVDSEYKPTQTEDWRINDINTYEYIFSEIISQFNDGYLDDRLWITDNFRKNYSIDNYGIYLSSLGLPDEETRRFDLSTFEDTSLSENTQDMLDNGNIVFYTRKRENGKLSSENKYTFSFEIDKDGKLDKLTVQDKIKIKDYEAIRDKYLDIFYNIIIDVNKNHKTSLIEYTESFHNDYDIDNIEKFKVLSSNEELIELKKRKIGSTDTECLYYAKILVNRNIEKYIAFCIIYNTDKNGRIVDISRTNKYIPDEITLIDYEEYNKEDRYYQEEY